MDRIKLLPEIVANQIADLFKKYDAVLMPACSKNEYTAYDIHQAFAKVYEESVFTAVANLIGIPALVSNGIQLMGKQFDESVLLSLAGSVERMGK